MSGKKRNENHAVCLHCVYHTDQMVWMLLQVAMVAYAGSLIFAIRRSKSKEPIDRTRACTASWMPHAIYWTRRMNKTKKWIIITLAPVMLFSLYVALLIASTSRICQPGIYDSLGCYEEWQIVLQPYVFKPVEIIITIHICCAVGINSNSQAVCKHVSGQMSDSPLCQKRAIWGELLNAVIVIV